ncbi:MAG: hypothetical protein IPN76_15735 [Saprospiraceae bacterium]|nr:hypothetical protein [Saprospiraceae bacterium]
MKNALLIFVLAIAVSASLMAQSDTIRFESLMNENVKAVVFTSGGDTMSGYLIKIDSSTLTVAFRDGGQETYFEDEITIIHYYLGRPKIKFDTIAGKYVERIFLNSTAFSLPKGDTEYRNVMLLYNGFHAGVTDNITIGGAVIPAGLLNLAILDAKTTIRIGKHAHGGVGLAMGVGFVKEGSFKSGPELFAGGFGVLTLGDKKRFINLLLGRVAGSGFSEYYLGEWIFSLGGKLSKKKVMYYTEFARHPAFFMELANITGLTFKVKSLIYDIGLLMPVLDFLPIPVVSISRRF